MSKEVPPPQKPSPQPQKGLKNRNPDISDDQIICFCHWVSAGQIREEMLNGATTLFDLQDRTRASTGCGGCQWELLDLLDEL